MPKLARVFWCSGDLPQESKYFWFIPEGLSGRTKDAGAWSIPKGEYLTGTDPLEAAQGSSSRRQELKLPEN